MRGRSEHCSCTFVCKSSQHVTSQWCWRNPRWITERVAFWEMQLHAQIHWLASLWVHENQHYNKGESVKYATAVCDARGLQLGIKPLSSQAVAWLLQYMSSKQASVKQSHESSHFTCTLWGKNSPCCIISLKVSSMSIPAVATQHREMQSRVVIMEHRSELTMALTPGLQPGWIRCVAVRRLTSQPG